MRVRMHVLNGASCDASVVRLNTHYDYYDYDCMNKVKLWFAILGVGALFAWISFEGFRWCLVYLSKL